MITIERFVPALILTFRQNISPLQDVDFSHSGLAN